MSRLDKKRKVAIPLYLKQDIKNQTVRKTIFKSKLFAILAEFLKICSLS